MKDEKKPRFTCESPAIHLYGTGPENEQMTYAKAWIRDSEPDELAIGITLDLRGKILHHYSAAELSAAFEAFLSRIQRYLNEQRET